MKNKKEAVAFSSILASAALATMKLVVGIFTGSVGILSEAAHSLLDLGAATLTYFAVKISDKPADEDHHYGHGKIESVSALIETALLFLTSGAIIYESVGRLLAPSAAPVHATWYAFGIIIVSIIVDYTRSRALLKEARASNSQALEADALHFSSDIWSSAVVFLGLVLVRFNIHGADTWAALGVALFVLVAGYRLGKRTIGVLIDTAPAGTTELVKESIKDIADIFSVHNIRVRPLGPSLFIEIEIGVSRRFSLNKVAQIIAETKLIVQKKIPNCEVLVHAKPLSLNSETIVDIIQTIAARQGLSTHNIMIENINKQKIISYDLEVPANLTLRVAHEITTAIEESIRQEIGLDAEIITHIDPLSTTESFSSLVTTQENNNIQKIITKIIKNFVLIYGVHDIQIRKISEYFIVTLRCYAPPQELLEAVHEEADLLKERIREAIPAIRRAIVHVEPEENKAASIVDNPT